MPVLYWWNDHRLKRTGPASSPLPDPDGWFDNTHYDSGSLVFAKYPITDQANSGSYDMFYGTYEWKVKVTDSLGNSKTRKLIIELVNTARPNVGDPTGGGNGFGGIRFP